MKFLSAIVYLFGHNNEGFQCGKYTKVVIHLNHLTRKQWFDIRK